MGWAEEGEFLVLNADMKLRTEDTDTIKAARLAVGRAASALTLQLGRR